MRRLCTITGIAQRTAEVVIAEIGVDMTRFPTARHLASWAGLCPGNHESAGKRRSGKARKADGALRVALCEAAWADHFHEPLLPIDTGKGRSRDLPHVENLTLVLEATIQGAFRSQHQSDLRAHSTNENPGSANGPT